MNLNVNRTKNTTTKALKYGDIFSLLDPPTHQFWMKVDIEEEIYDRLPLMTNRCTALNLTTFKVILMDDKHVFKVLKSDLTLEV